MFLFLVLSLVYADLKSMCGAGESLAGYSTSGTGVNRCSRTRKIKPKTAQTQSIAFFEKDMIPIIIVSSEEETNGPIDVVTKTKDN